MLPTQDAPSTSTLTVNLSQQTELGVKLNLVVIVMLTVSLPSRISQCFIHTFYCLLTAVTESMWRRTAAAQRRANENTNEGLKFRFSVDVAACGLDAKLTISCIHLSQLSPLHFLYYTILSFFLLILFFVTLSILCSVSFSTRLAEKKTGRWFGSLSPSSSLFLLFE